MCFRLYFITCFSKYGDFHTIDWQRDLARDRIRHKSVAARRKDFPFGTLFAMWDAGSGWACVLMVGLAAGAIAGIIDIGARWMSDLKVTLINKNNIIFRKEVVFFV